MEVLNMVIGEVRTRVYLLLLLSSYCFGDFGGHGLPWRQRARCIVAERRNKKKRGRSSPLYRNG